MLRSRRPLTGLLSLILVSVSAASPGGRAPTLLASQTTPAVSPAQAAPYIGDWTAAVTSQMGPTTYTVSVKIDLARPLPSCILICPK